MSATGQKSERDRERVITIQLRAAKRKKNVNFIKAILK